MVQLFYTAPSGPKFLNKNLFLVASLMRGVVFMLCIPSGTMGEQEVYLFMDRTTQNIQPRSNSISYS